MMLSRLFIAALITSLALLSVSTTVAGPTPETYVVTRDDDPPVEGCQPGDCTLREAILAANAHPGADIVELGEHEVMLMIAGEGEDEGQTGDLDITDSVTITGVSPEKSALNGNQID